MRIFVVAAALCLAVTAPPPASAADSAPQAPPETIWRDAPDGGLEHLQSGLACPRSLGEYDRRTAFVFDNFGLDVGCDYQAREASVTLYLTRRTQGGLDEAMAEAKRELVQFGAADNPQLLTEQRYDEAGHAWTTALYAKDGGRHSGIWMTDLYGWTLEYRATYSLAVESQVQADLKAFTAQIASTAGTRLALCAKPAPPERHGAAAPATKDDSATSLMDALVGAAAIQTAVQDKHAKPKPVLWCVERPLKIEGHGALYWRGVDETGADARTDQVTALTIKTTPGLTVTPDTMGGLIEALGKKDGDDAPPRWVAVLEAKSQSTIFGYFNGRPTPEVLAELFGRIMAGKAKPLASYDASRKNITITMPKE
ncbi:hypothetical protein [Phenylobacterium montanum]|uniref:Uncharacterized protein n=1 Tax=Phenylobacterium montanum TaxID=2823693 RepID=A0A975G0I4_9CAUL|nr:hypothetical protein [Caulobacter sp. S6]QUD88675.1 hypothetical protein KCG34_01955 [Caulobacter sp. S6]